MEVKLPSGWINRRLDTKIRAWASTFVVTENQTYYIFLYYYVLILLGKDVCNRKMEYDYFEMSPVIRIPDPEAPWETKEVLNPFVTELDEIGSFEQYCMDDFIVLYVKAAADRKLKVYDDGMIVLPEEEIEPTCISDVDDERFRVQLWKMKGLLETQVKKERFWEIDEEFLLEIGTCIGELMFAKLKVKTEQA